jgi:hypothetical protein
MKSPMKRGMPIRTPRGPQRRARVPRVRITGNEVRARARWPPRRRPRVIEATTGNGTMRVETVARRAVVSLTPMDVSIPTRAPSSMAITSRAWLPARMAVAVAAGVPAGTAVCRAPVVLMKAYSTARMTAIEITAWPAARRRLRPGSEPTMRSRASSPAARHRSRRPGSAACPSTAVDDMVSKVDPAAARRGRRVAPSIGASSCEQGEARGQGYRELGHASSGPRR